MQGPIIRLLPAKGYGFVRSSENGLTYFVHAKEVKPRLDFDRLCEGETVEFDPGENENAQPHQNKLRALNVRRLQRAG